jgi:hypothetical protein
MMNMDGTLSYKIWQLLYFFNNFHFTLLNSIRYNNLRADFVLEYHDFCMLLASLYANTFSFYPSLHCIASSSIHYSN